MSLKKEEKTRSERVPTEAQGCGQRQVAVKLKHGEYAVRLKVTKPVRCQECHKELTRGQFFWLDYIPLKRPRGNQSHYKKVICEACWRGPRNVWSER